MHHNSTAARRVPQTTCAAERPADHRLMWAFLVGPIFALLVLALPAFAQSMPENASPRSYGDGWECNIGYRLVDEACAAVTIPENAYETKRAYGAGWECYHGFREVDDVACVAVAVPEGGYLDPSGKRWLCSRGFLKVDETCQEVIVPENAFLVDATYGSAWKCDRGFFEKDGQCEAVIVPENAYFDDSTYGKGWKCERGFAASGASCEAIDVPANAHLDRSGNRWDCNRNFQKSKGLCVQRN